MILRILAAVLALSCAAQAQERVSVGALRLTSNGPLFLAAGQGYFKAEGLDVDIKFYGAAQPVAQAVASGEVDIGITAFTAALFNLGGKGAIKAVAAQAVEKRDYEGNGLLVSAQAFNKGFKRVEDLPGRSLGITQLGSSFHYQAGQFARAKGFDLSKVTLKPLQSLDAVASALSSGQVDAAILPAQLARNVLVSGNAKVLSWYSEIGEQQLGAVFVSSKLLQAKRATAEKFIRAYRKGAADYAQLLKRDRFGKRITNDRTQAAFVMIGKYLDPARPPAAAAAMAEEGLVYVDAQARLDVADIERQVSWFKAQGLVESGVELRSFIDAGFAQ